MLIVVWCQAVGEVRFDRGGVLLGGGAVGARLPVRAVGGRRRGRGRGAAARLPQRAGLHAGQADDALGAHDARH